MSANELFSLEGRVAVVTGGACGIGWATSVALGQAGAFVVVAARDEDRNNDAVDRLTSMGVKALAVRLDVTRRAEISAMVERVESLAGPISVLVNNAGFGIDSEAVDLPDTEWDEVLATNLSGVWKVSQTVGAGMLQRGAGSIVNIGSISGFIVNRPQWHASYGAAKAGVHHLTRSLAAEWAPRGVRVNAIAPGFVRTNDDGFATPEHQHYWQDQVPMRRMARPDEIAPTAVYLASDAASFVTGAVIVVDGGYTLW